MRISDWSSDVCSSDLPGPHAEAQQLFEVVAGLGEQVEPVDGVAVHVGHDQHALAAQVLDGHGGGHAAVVAEGVEVGPELGHPAGLVAEVEDRKSTRLNSSH